MKTKKGRTESPLTDENVASLRALISFPPEVYRTLEGVAGTKRVSLAEPYIAEKWPLLRKSLS